jgi:hypothetical protein
LRGKDASGAIFLRGGFMFHVMKEHADEVDVLLQRLKPAVLLIASFARKGS